MVSDEKCRSRSYFFRLKLKICNKYAERSDFMKKIAILLTAALAIFFIASCSTVKPVAGATGIVGKKTGEATQAWFGGFPLKGEGGILQAAKNGGITKVGTVDVRIDWPASPIFGYYVVTTVVSGE